MAPAQADAQEVEKEARREQKRREREERRQQRYLDALVIAVKLDGRDTIVRFCDWARGCPEPLV